MTNQVLFLNIPFSVSGPELSAFCARVVSATKAEVLVDEITGRSKGVGIVAFESVVDANRIVKELNGGTLKGAILRLEIATPAALSGLTV